MTDTPKGRTPPAPLPAGGSVMAIIPQTWEETTRMANAMLAGGIAPLAILPKPVIGEDAATTAQRNIAAVAGIIAAGAELGLPPLASLRSFTNINGKFGLYADGNVAVVRKARDDDGTKLAKNISVGFVAVKQYACPYCATKGWDVATEVRDHITAQHPDDDATVPLPAYMGNASYAWCESERSDNGETHREEFSVDDAIAAGLWDDAPTIEKDEWAYDPAKKKRLPTGKKVQVPNDSAWHRYAKRMLQWRATGYCLRHLYADVLTGMVDEYEAREAINITPATIDRPVALPPEPPPEPEAPPAGTTPAAEGDDQPHGEAGGQSDTAAPPVEADTVEDALAELEELLSHADDADEVEGAFDSFDVQGRFSGDEDALSRAFAIKRAALGEPLHKSDQPAGGKNEVPHDPVTGEIADAPPEPPDEDATPRAEGVNDMFNENG